TDSTYAPPRAGQHKQAVMHRGVPKRVGIGYNMEASVKRRESTLVGRVLGDRRHRVGRRSAKHRAGQGFPSAASGRVVTRRFEISGEEVNAPWHVQMLRLTTTWTSSTLRVWGWPMRPVIGTCPPASWGAVTMILICSTRGSTLSSANPTSPRRW